MTGSYSGPDPRCRHDRFDRVGGMNGVYECVDCGGRITIPRFRWLEPGGDPDRRWRDETR